MKKWINGKKFNTKNCLPVCGSFNMENGKQHEKNIYLTKDGEILLEDIVYQKPSMREDLRLLKPDEGFEVMQSMGYDRDEFESIIQYARSMN